MNDDEHLKGIHAQHARAINRAQGSRHEGLWCAFHERAFGCLGEALDLAVTTYATREDEGGATQEEAWSCLVPYNLSLRAQALDFTSDEVERAWQEVYNIRDRNQ